MGSISFALVLVTSLTCLAAVQCFTLNMKTIAVFGGTGQTGRECVAQALAEGYKVISLSRSGPPLLSPPRLGETPITDPNLTVLQGSVTSPEDVMKVFAASDGIDGVVISLGGKTKDVGATMLSEGTANIVDAMNNKGVKRVSVVSSIGCGDSENQAPLVFKALMYTVMKGIFKDKNKQEKIFLEGAGSGLEYCLVRPGGLGVGEPTGVINVIDGQAGSIMRADVAAFCLGAVTDANFEYVRKTPCISSVGGTGWVKEKKAGFDAATTA
jgi:nucleoside-diphosphate-sugar epimerase